MGIGTVLGGGLSLAGGLFQSRAANKGAGQMAGGNILAALLQQQMYQQQMANLQPYLQYGQSALQELAPLIGIGGDPLSAPLTSRFAPTQERLEQTPGYQFTRDQGLKNLQNAFAAKGLGSSGNALRGAAEYATGLASNTFQQQFQNYWGENKNIFDMLSGAGGVGLSAAGAGANLAGTFGNNIGNALQGAGNAYGQGTMAGSNALWRGIGDAYGIFNANMGSQPSSFWNRPLRNLF